MKKIQKNSSKFTEKDITNLINRMKFVFATRKEIQFDIDTAKEELKNDIKLLPSREQFFRRMDKLSGEIKAKREAQDLHSDQHSQINDRFDRIDKHLGISTAS